MEGNIDLKEGNNAATQAPIKISLDTGDIADARQLIAQRINAAEAKAKAEAESKAKAEAEAKAKAEAEAKAKAEAEAKAKAEAEAKAKAEAEAKAKAEAEAKAKAEAEAKAKAEAEAEAKAKAKAEAEAKAKAEAQAKAKAEAQAKAKAQAQAKAKAAQEAKTTQLNDAFADLIGDGGGDGSRTSDQSANDFERYKARIQSEVNNNFSYNPAFTGRQCAVDVNIASDGTLTPYQGSARGQANVCALGVQAIVNTGRVTPPPAGMLSQVQRVTLVFIVR
ncbi:protein TolA [Psittacicella gerlachiana]|uniref:Protein TolA n=2 Tax=Psittacicella gerlachiana TaxID=2028574 RepID=A0A3A1YBB2_9GAMM|nr:protein TolA [Psittacicella gerlachiana]